jgi:hypothetical protein
MRTAIALALITATAIVASASSVTATVLVTGADVQDGTLTGADIRDGSIRSRDLNFNPEHTGKVYSNHRPMTDRQARDEGGYVRLPVDASWAVVDTLANLPAGTYSVESSLTIQYNMGGTIDVQCGFTTTSGTTAVQGVQELQLEYVSTKTNQYQQFPMAPLVMLTLPGGGSVNLVCRNQNTKYGVTNAVALNTYLYATPISSFSHT